MIKEKPNAFSPAKKEAKMVASPLAFQIICFLEKLCISFKTAESILQSLIPSLFLLFLSCVSPLSPFLPQLLASSLSKNLSLCHRDQLISIWYFRWKYPVSIWVFTDFTKLDCCPGKCAKLKQKVMYFSGHFEPHSLYLINSTILNFLLWSFLKEGCTLVSRAILFLWYLERIICNWSKVGNGIQNTSRHILIAWHPKLDKDELKGRTWTVKFWEIMGMHKQIEWGGGVPREEVLGMTFL